MSVKQEGMSRDDFKDRQQLGTMDPTYIEEGKTDEYKFEPAVWENKNAEFNGMYPTYGWRIFNGIARSLEMIMVLNHSRGQRVEDFSLGWNGRV